MRYGWQALFFVFGVFGMIWAAVWFIWFRDWPIEKAGVGADELHEIGAEPPVRHGGMPWGRALQDAMFWRIAGIGVSYVYVLAFFQSWLQTYLVRDRGYTESALLLSSLPYVVGGMANGIGGLASDSLVRRYGLKSAAGRLEWSG
jgi:hypothetical protein